MGRFKRYIQILKIFFIRGGYKRADYLKRIIYFKKQGQHCYFQPYNFGTEPQMLSFGDNVHVASGVTFVSHDITAFMFQYMDPEHTYNVRRGEIKIGNNVFIGSNSTLLYDVTIGDNVIIGASTLVNKDIPSGSIVAGVPCKVIGHFEDYKEKIKNMEGEALRNEIYNQKND